MVSTGCPRVPGEREVIESPQLVQAESLTIKQTATGYWVVQQGGVHLAGAMTREAAEAERDLLVQLRDRSVRRQSRPGASVRDRGAGNPDRIGAS
jgi:hypothetical protein